MNKLIKLHENKKFNADEHEKEVLTDFFDYLQDAMKDDKRRTEITRDKLKKDYKIIDSTEDNDSFKD